VRISEGAAGATTTGEYIPAPVAATLVTEETTTTTTGGAGAPVSATVV
jgi:hypothetical protein